MLEIFSGSAWQMGLGERAAMEGVLSQRKPRLAVAIRATDCSLQRLAAHCDEVHSLDLTASPVAGEDSTIIAHTGDLREVVPQVLDQLAGENRNVDFVLVDGGPSAGSVRSDLDALLSSPAVADSVILVTQTANEQVRSSADSVRYAAYPKVAHVNLDFVPGYILRDPGRRYELWGGLGLVLVDATRTAYFPAEPVIEDRYYKAGDFYPQIRDLVMAQERGEPSSPAETRDHRTLAEELDAVRAERDHHRRVSASVTDSLSWRMTEPLRAAKGKVRRAAAKVLGNSS